MDQRFSGIGMTGFREGRSDAVQVQRRAASQIPEAEVLGHQLARV
jgi:hypothetical protein